MYACMYVWMYTCMHVCLYACVHMCIRALSAMCMHAMAHVSRSMYACMHGTYHCTYVRMHNCPCEANSLLEPVLGRMHACISHLSVCLHGSSNVFPMLAATRGFQLILFAQQFAPLSPIPVIPEAEVATIVVDSCGATIVVDRSNT
jgi:hypothetical protein